MNPGTLLETRDLTRRFGGLVAVNDVNFKMAEGELRCLIGPNGAGKSTFFKMLTGQLTPSSGSILFRGRESTSAHSHDIARLGIGIKTQTPSVFNGLTVHENLRLAARRKNSRARADEIVDQTLEKIRMAHHARALVGNLSHGQRQWIEIGVVLSGEPELILLDEPAAGMTHDEIDRTADLIKEINQTTAIIVVEHDMQFIKRIATIVTVFHQGAILVEGPVLDVMRDSRVRDVYLGKKAAA